MENKTTVAIIFSTLLCVLAHSTALRRTESLFDTILKRNIVDRSEFKASDQRFRDANTLVHSQNGVKESDKIWRLPGQPMVSFNQYGGYVTVDQKAGRALYYYFAEADQRSANTLPLLLWLNGGPGCSSLGYGAMLELGPFRVHSDGKTLYTNSFAWNKVANVLFLESPAGVGFSYSNTTNDTVNGDDASTAVDNYAFLLNWLERFPEYKNRDLYICGESYSGHYVPQLAQTVLQYNEMAKKIIINLKGILIGNPVINDETDGRGTIEYLGSHALISDDITNEILKYCNFSPSAHDSDNCENAFKEARKELGFIDYFNPYNIYASLCSNHNLTLKPKITSVFNFDPCSGDYVHAYLNRPEVQRALHANVTKLHYDWQSCSDLVIDNWNWKDSPSNILPLLKELMANGLRIWIYSGDVDLVVSVTSTKLSIKLLELPIQILWRPWYLCGEVGGYTTMYKGNLTFATIRGAGHQVPSDKPVRALTLIKSFLIGTELPIKSSKT